MPCTKRSTSSGRVPAFSSAASTAWITPSDWSRGVLGAFAVITRSPSSRTASVNVPPTSTPRSIGPTYRSTPASGAGAYCYRSGSRADERLLEVLVRRAVLRARQRHALAGRALARRRVAAQGRAVERDALALALVHVLGGDRHVALDRLVDAQLRLDREVHAHVVEERSRRAGEVVAVC